MLSVLLGIYKYKKNFLKDFCKGKQIRPTYSVVVYRLTAPNISCFKLVTRGILDSYLGPVIWIMYLLVEFHDLKLRVFKNAL